jgi:hypothetical protein
VIFFSRNWQGMKTNCRAVISLCHAITGNEVHVLAYWLIVGSMSGSSLPFMEPRVHYCIHVSPPPVLIMSHTDPGHILTPYLLEEMNKYKFIFKFNRMRCEYKITLRCICVTIVAVESNKYYILGVFVCSLIYSAYCY